ncbi:MAG TPA: HAD family hydrolase, partial [Labilithrix sp.]|nr:HAD family hydrolase [Labilithrix sp.]
MGTVLLFDIDGTLVSTGGAGRRAMVAAFANLHGHDRVFEGTSFAGMTDRAIARHGLRELMAEISEADIDRALDGYLTLLEAELAKADGYRVLPGVMKLLASLHGTPDVALGLGTGNVRRGAYAKLARGGLDGAFTFGGFGCDAEDRVELLRAGARRGADLLGRSLERCRVVVIGDTPKDVAAAKGLGARCVGVGTG